MFRSGFLPLGKWWDVPVRMHWTTPLLCLFFTRFHFLPAAWLALILLIIAHEFGHAFFVLRFDRRVLGIELGAIGGLCRYEGPVTPTRRSIIAWGGVLAQGLVLIATLIAGQSPTLMSDPYSAQVYEVWTSTNLMMIGLNLLPIPPLDGAHAWTLAPKLLVRHRAQKARVRKAQRVEEMSRLSTDLANGKMSPDLEAQLKNILADD
jgi:Zn-dependent protease